MMPSGITGLERVNATPGPFTPGKQTRCTGVSGPNWADKKIFALAGVRTPVHPARSLSLYRQSYAGRHCHAIVTVFSSQPKRLSLPTFKHVCCFYVSGFFYSCNIKFSGIPFSLQHLPWLNIVALSLVFSCLLCNCRYFQIGHYAAG